MTTFLGNTRIQTQTATESNAGSILSKTLNPVTLKFVDIVYKIKTKKSEDRFRIQNSKADSERFILNGVSGTVYPGEILAMLGPSGSGKTTLLSALGGRLGGNLKGKITYNGKPFTSSMKRNTGFVTQDDVLYPHLTVTETLIYTALLRLPNNLSKEEKVQHAEIIINELGLTACRNSIIGGPLLRGVSGGERKRVSIGQEMLINPSLLFLDEPTSGLDSTTAQKIVSTLWELARCDRTIVMSIHQPSSRIFYMFHKVVLLSDGNPIYFGKGSDAMDYFESIGHTPSVAMNPSDFLLDLANGLTSDEYETDEKAVKQGLVTTYYDNLESKLKEEIGTLEEHDQLNSRGKSEMRWSTTWWQQFIVLLERGLKERRHESFSGLKVFQVLIVALMSGLIWWQSNLSHLQDQIGLLFFYSGFWGFFPLFQALFAFPQEREMLVKERSSGMYRLSSYFMARIVGDLPMELILPTIFVIITYFMAGLRRTAANFFATLFVLLYSVLVAQGLGFALGALVMDLKSATTLGSVIMLTFLLAGGYYVRHVPEFISWTRYVSLPHYSYKLLMGSQYSTNQYYPCKPNVYCKITEFPGIAAVGLNQNGVAAMALAVMLVGYRLIAYASLTRLGKVR